MVERTIHDVKGPMDDLWRYDDDPDDDPDDDVIDDEAEADPSCIDCGGLGGWCGDFSPVGVCIWVECDCVS